MPSMQRLASLLRSPFSFLFARSSAEDRVAAYVVREHARGRGLSEILEDRYVQNRLTVEQQRRLLDRPEVVHALGDDAVEQTRRELEALTTR
jgi:ribosomal protein S12 methylthiotransferase accessory factor YcaO